MVDLRALCAGDVIEFVQRQTKFLQPAGLKAVVTGLRTFLRYAQYRGEVSILLAAAVPIAAAWTSTAVPKAISPDHDSRRSTAVTSRSAGASRASRTRDQGAVTRRL